MSDQNTKANEFHALHVKNDPVILYNVWDAGSAKAVASAGAKAIATGSWPVAAASGFDDGENLPMEFALDNVRRIIDSVDLPVSLDFEGGYAVDPDGVQANVEKAIGAGIVGINFEDQIVGGSGFHPIDEQTKRVAATRKAAETSGVNLFINARTDLFLKSKPEDHNAAMLNEAVERAKAYEGAGANGFFAPALIDESMIETLCKAVNLPVNIIAIPGAPANARLAELGVGRISYGPVPYRKMIATLEDAARAVFDGA